MNRDLKVTKNIITTMKFKPGFQIQINHFSKEYQRSTNITTITTLNSIDTLNSQHTMDLLNTTNSTINSTKSTKLEPVNNVTTTAR